MTNPSAFTTREEWLVAAVSHLAPLFAEAGIAALPAVRVSVGFPGGRGKKQTVIGQCWAGRMASDGLAQIFVSPVLDDGVAVLETLAHELVHAVDECKSGHKGAFASLAKRIGFLAPMTATPASDGLKVRLAGMLDTLGAYPHAALSSGAQGADGGKKQGTRMLKVECAATGYTVRTTRKWLDEYGAPVCPCCEERMLEAA